MENLESGAYLTLGIIGTERAIKEIPKSKGFRIFERGTFQEHEMRSEASLACFDPEIHACIQTLVILT